MNVIKSPLIVTLDCNDEAEVTAHASTLAKLLKAGDSILLRGDLGAGKTTFSRALIREHADDVTLHVPSPTFTLLQSYDEGDVPLYHYDLYRVEHPDELIEIGFADAPAERITVVEWPEKAEDDMAGGSLDIVIEDCGESRRRLIFCGNEVWRKRLEKMHG